MFTAIKEKFGFTYLQTKDPVLQDVLFAFCNAKGYWWNNYFGWRRSIILDVGHEIMFFWIPSNKIEELENLAKHIKEKCK